MGYINAPVVIFI